MQRQIQNEIMNALAHNRILFFRCPDCGEKAFAWLPDRNDTGWRWVCTTCNKEYQDDKIDFYCREPYATELKEAM